jgi:hypothetical protein
MFEAARRHMRSVAMIGVASALTVGGVAVAQDGSGGDVQPAKRPMHAPLMGSEMSSLALAELRAPQEAESRPIPVDQGIVKSAENKSALPRKGDVVRAIHGAPMPPPPGEELQLEMVPAR